MEAAEELCIVDPGGAVEVAKAVPDLAPSCRLLNKPDSEEQTGVACATGDVNVSRAGADRGRAVTGGGRGSSSGAKGGGVGKVIGGGKGSSGARGGVTTLLLSAGPTNCGSTGCRACGGATINGEVTASDPVWASAVLVSRSIVEHGVHSAGLAFASFSVSSCMTG